MYLISNQQHKDILRLLDSVSKPASGTRHANNVRKSFILQRQLTRMNKLLPEEVVVRKNG